VPSETNQILIKLHGITPQETQTARLQSGGHSSIPAETYYLCYEVKIHFRTGDEASFSRSNVIIARSQQITSIYAKGKNTWGYISSLPDITT
jgi:hypothetical protein